MKTRNKQQTLLAVWQKSQRRGARAAMTLVDGTNAQPHDLEELRVRLDFLARCGHGSLAVSLLCTAPRRL